MRKLAPIALLALLMCGCTFIGNVRKDTYINQTAGLSEEVKNAIRKGELLQGMSTGDVEAAWGQPGEVKRSVGGDQSVTQWIYGHRNVTAGGLAVTPEKTVTFRDGKVVKWDK